MKLRWCFAKIIRSLHRSTTQAAMTLNLLSVVIAVVEMYHGICNNITKHYLYFSKIAKLASKMFKLAGLIQSRYAFFCECVFFLWKKKNVYYFWISHVILSLSIYYACLIGKSEILFGRCVYKLLLPYSPQPIYHFGRVFNITLYMPSPKYFIAHNFKIDRDKQLLI